MGLVRAVVRTTVDTATPLWHRRRLLQIDVDSGVGGSTTVVVDEGEGDVRADFCVARPSESTTVVVDEGEGVTLVPNSFLCCEYY
jgi:hypothetical protein